MWWRPSISSHLNNAVVNIALYLFYPFVLSNPRKIHPAILNFCICKRKHSKHVRTIYVSFQVHINGALATRRCCNVPVPVLTAMALNHARVVQVWHHLLIAPHDAGTETCFRWHVHAPCRAICRPKMLSFNGQKKKQVHMNEHMIVLSKI